MRTISPVLALGLVACGGPDLSGKWEGGMNCGGQSEAWDTVLELESAGGGDYTGTGAAEMICEGVDDWCIVRWDTEVSQTANWATQDLEMTASNCTVEFDGEVDDDICFTPRFVLLKNETTIQGYLDNCVFEVRQ